MDTDLDTLATALYVTTDDLLRAHPERVPVRPKIGIVPRTSDAEMLTLAVMQALLGFTSETQWLRYARKNLLAMFPTLPLQPVGAQCPGRQPGSLPLRSVDAMLSTRATSKTMATGCGRARCR